MVLLGCARLSNLRLNRYSTVLSHRFALTFIFISYLYTSMSTPRRHIPHRGRGGIRSGGAGGVFRRQAAECAPYREYLSLIGVRPGEVRTADAIPYLPIGLFKTHEVYCGGTEPEAVFTSSATTGMTPSRHPMRSLSLYEQAFRASFQTFYGEPARWSLYALLPNYLRRKGSSLVYMADPGFCPTAARAAFTSTTTKLCWGRCAATPSPRSCWA